MSWALVKLFCSLLKRVLEPSLYWWSGSSIWSSNSNPFQLYRHWSHMRGSIFISLMHFPLKRHMAISWLVMPFPCRFIAGSIGKLDGDASWALYKAILKEMTDTSVMPLFLAVLLAFEWLQILWGGSQLLSSSDLISLMSTQEYISSEICGFHSASDYHLSIASWMLHCSSVLSVLIIVRIIAWSPWHIPALTGHSAQTEMGSHFEQWKLINKSIYC